MVVYRGFDLFEGGIIDSTSGRLTNSFQISGSIYQETVDRIRQGIRQSLSLRWQVRSYLITPALIVVAACGQPSSVVQDGAEKRGVKESIDPPNSNEKLPEPEMPSQGRKLAEWLGPPDGKIHVRTVGNIRVHSDTKICFLDPKIALSLSGVNVPAWARSDAARSSLARGQGLRLDDGSERMVFWRHGDCDAPGDYVYVRVQTLPNRDGGPYRLVVVAWQGEATWIADLERLADPSRIETWGEMNPSHLPKANLAQSIDFAGQKIFGKFSIEILSK